MGAGRGESEAVTLRGFGGAGTKLGERGERLDRRRADLGRQLDHRGKQLHFQHAGQRPLLGPGDQRLDPGRESEGLGVEDHQLLLDADREWRALTERLLDHRPKLVEGGDYGFQEPRTKRMV